MILLFGLVVISSQSQSLNIDETLNYIENQLNDKNNKSISGSDRMSVYDITQTYDLDYTYSVKVDKGLLYIVKKFKSSYFPPNKYEKSYFIPIVEELSIPISNLDLNYNYYSPYHNYHCKLQSESGPVRFIIYNKSESSRLVTKVVKMYYTDGKERYNKTEKVSNIYFDYSNDNLLCEKLRNAVVHLLSLFSKDGSYTKNSDLSNDDPFAPKMNIDTILKNKISVNSNLNTVPMIKRSGVYEIPVTINGVLKLDFIFDAGASDVSISADVALTLLRTGTIKDKDFLGTETYKFADGSTAKSKVFLLKEVQIGNKKVSNVRASISSSLNAPLLLGQSVLNRFGKVTIDYKNNTITFQE